VTNLIPERRRFPFGRISYSQTTEELVQASFLDENAKQQYLAEIDGKMKQLS
jgi:hypothetical protein